MTTVRCDDDGLAAAAAVLTRGGVVVIPTDTVYGLAAHPDFPEAVERLYTIKGREAKKPIALLAADADAAHRFGAEFPPRAAALAAAHWPGALTLVLPILGDDVSKVGGVGDDVSKRRQERTVNVSTATTIGVVVPQVVGPQAYEGFRVPDHDWTRRLLAACGGVLRVTSANLSGQRPATDAPQALADVGLSADLVVDDGVSPGGTPSSVVRVSPDNTLTILRDGGVGDAVSTATTIGVVVPQSGGVGDDVSKRRQEQEQTTITKSRL